MTRAFHIYRAKVYLRESRLRTATHRGFSFLLLTWAANARREAASVSTQGSLF